MVGPIPLEDKILVRVQVSQLYLELIRMSLSENENFVSISSPAANQCAPSTHHGE